MRAPFLVKFQKKLICISLDGAVHVQIRAQAVSNHFNIIRKKLGADFRCAPVKKTFGFRDALLGKLTKSGGN